MKAWGRAVEGGSVDGALEAVPGRVPVPAGVDVPALTAVVGGTRMCWSWRWQGSEGG